MVLLQPYFHSSSISQLLTLWSLFKCKPLPLKSFPEEYRESYMRVTR